MFESGCVVGFGFGHSPQDVGVNIANIKGACSSTIDEALTIDPYFQAWQIYDLCSC